MDFRKTTLIQIYFLGFLICMVLLFFACSWAQDWEPVVLTKTRPGTSSGADGAKKGGSCKQTTVGVDIRHLEDEEGDGR